MQVVAIYTAYVRRFDQLQLAVMHASEREDWAAVEDLAKQLQYAAKRADVVTHKFMNEAPISLIRRLRQAESRHAG